MRRINRNSTKRITKSVVTSNNRLVESFESFINKQSNNGRLNEMARVGDIDLGNVKAFDLFKVGEKWGFYVGAYQYELGGGGTTPDFIFDELTVEIIRVNTKIITSKSNIATLVTYKFKYIYSHSDNPENYEIRSLVLDSGTTVYDFIIKLVDEITEEDLIESDALLPGTEEYRFSDDIDKWDIKLLKPYLLKYHSRFD